ncbi:hypothetical protein GCM10009733_024170 [Nonomuraea maheshkhaliensis]|uniref:Uncharacterized protein n=1 Tax=Nonomuraea maheshkhaliensis TaxID=419590 RepID=A0ABN2F2D3_9ACTN
MIHRVLAEFLHARRLAWSFIALRDPFWQPLMAYIDQRALPEPVTGGDQPTPLYAHDWRTMPVGRWLEASGMVELDGPDDRPVPAYQQGESFAVLSHEQLTAAVTQALHDLRRPDRLAANPLIRTRLLAEAGPGERADRLRHLLTSAIGTLAGDARTAKFHRALATAYLHAAPTQEASAERLAVSLSTYRRHLARGTDLIVQQLWERELHGNDQ